jgi:hypothetical protein
MLAEILARLPSLPSLARAALACLRLRDVAASPLFATSFVPPPPLLGYFVSAVDADIPSFHRALLLSGRDVAAVVRRGDFCLAGFEDFSWRLMDSRQGLLLLASDSRMAVFDPVSGSRLHMPHYTSSGKSSSSFHCFLLPCADGTSFRVLCLETTGGAGAGRVRLHVYSSRTGQWLLHSLAPKHIKPPRRGDLYSNYSLPMYAGGRIYWRTQVEMLSSLDVGSMEFSHVALPDDVHRSSYALGDTEDGTTCIVSVSTIYEPALAVRGLSVCVWFLKEEGGSLSWERQCVVDASEMDPLVGPLARSRMLKVYNVTAGVVLVSPGCKNNCVRYLAFRLKDMLQEGATETNTKPQSLILADFCASNGWVLPCFMAWPRLSLKVH